ncbi:acyl-CoA dehydrogenase family protein [Streptomyces orinoci]|uniref:Acyl-CoA dehydrogenase family protein n=1 Tax=Streptomyces orinoci TaxID=67339 RepID=A0ABV3JYE3_STRON|nr:acyl-CoA dehydrogenase family protein [Streptomyces orinoci]
MDVELSAEQREIRRTLRELLLKRCGSGEVRAAVATPAGWDLELWRELAGLGLPGLAVPKRYGGVGCGWAELALAAEETGRFLLPSPLLATSALAAPLIAALGTSGQRAELLPALASGRLTATLVVPRAPLPTALALTGANDATRPPGDGPGAARPADAIGPDAARPGAARPADAIGPDAARPGAARSADGPETARPAASRPAGDWSDDWSGGGRTGGVQARQTASGWRLFGDAAQVLDGHGADLLLVAAHTGGYVHGHPALFVAAAHPSVRRIRLTALDETRPQARLEFRDTPAEPLGRQPADPRPDLARLGGSFAAVLAAEATGAAGRALELTLEHVKVREQFGRPIGSFQAVKHRLAELYVAVRAARSAAYYAAWAVTPESGAVHPSPAAALALAQALHAQSLVAGEAVQLHGGLGVTWEHDVQLYFKRAASDALLFGPVHRLRARAAEAVGLFEAGRYQEAVVL